jgi:hypothetical protein
MKIVEITSLVEYTVGMTTRYYHVTPHTRLKSILQQGILPSRRRQWKNYMGTQLGETKMVYLFNNLDSAIQFAAKLEWGLISEKRKVTAVDILEIQANLPVEADMNIEAQMDGAGKWLKTNRPVPAAAIRRVIPLTLDMKRDFIARRDGRSAAPQPEPETKDQTSQKEVSTGPQPEPFPSR